jgi:hypothetical protein
MIKLEKEIVIIMGTFKLEVSRGAEACRTASEAIEKGFVKYIDGIVSLQTESGHVCTDRQLLEETKEMMLNGLLEKEA